MCYILLFQTPLAAIDQWPGPLYHTLWPRGTGGYPVWAQSSSEALSAFASGLSPLPRATALLFNGK